jgi:predicted DNA-binding protein (MmcQ/YjbR family)
MGMAGEDARLVRISQIASSLPEAVRAVQGDHADFRVRKRVFAYFLNNHHGDGIISVCVRSALGENVDRAGAEPDRYYLPAYIGRRGWFGLRLDRGAIDWNEVRNILQASYCLAAPKPLAALMALQMDEEASTPRAKARRSAPRLHGTESS